MNFRRTWKVAVAVTIVMLAFAAGGAAFLINETGSARKPSSRL
jgi:hypothetical protein